MKNYILTIDQSTTNTKLFLLNQKKEIIAQYDKKHQQIYPHTGWVEHDPMEIYHNVMYVIRQAFQAYPQLKEELACISITNQRETALAWDHRSGLPIYNAIVWQCRRTKKMCKEWKQYEEIVTRKTGLKIDPYFSATKWVWMMEQIAMEGKDVRFGTMDSWLMYKLSGQTAHVCDHTNASRTLLYNLSTCTWDDELLDIFHIPKQYLPEIKQSDEFFCETDLEGMLIDKVPICGVIGDSQAALYAQHCVHRGDVKITLGTGSSVLMNQGERPMEPRHGLVSTLAWKQQGQTHYACEAIINSCTDTLNWLRDDLQLFQKDEELNMLTLEEVIHEEIVLVPAFHGISIPYWNNNCKASIQYISRNTTRKNILCAGLASIAFQIVDALTAMKKESQLDVNVIMADGGATKNRTLMQLLSDLTDCKIHVKQTSDLSAMGSYDIARKTIFQKIQTQEEKMCIYTPNMEQKQRVKLLARWQSAIKKTLYEEEKQ